MSGTEALSAAPEQGAATVWNRRETLLLKGYLLRKGPSMTLVDLAPVLLAILLFICMSICLRIGAFLGRRRHDRLGEAGLSGTSAVDGAIFSIFGLLLAFSLNGAAGRYELRRDLTRQEADAIGTAYQRLDFLPADQQPALRLAFRDYVDMRLKAEDKSQAAREQDMLQAIRLQARIWGLLTSGRDPLPGSIINTLAPPINGMFDATTRRMVLTNVHPPKIIFGLLFTLSLTSATYAGYMMWRNKSLSPLHTYGYAFAVCAVMFTILDLEYPVLGLIQLNSPDHVMLDLKQDMARTLPIPVSVVRPK